MARAEPTVPDWAIGCMDREYIVLDGGARDPSIAIWIQTESQYIDIRIPHDRPDLSRASSLADYGVDELRALAHQSGDTGVCEIRDQVATWHSASPSFGFFCESVSMFPDDGRLEPRGSVLYEYQTQKSPVAYEEAWVQQPYDHGLIAHLSLREDREPEAVRAVLLVTGRYAGYVECSTSTSELTLEAQLAAARGDEERIRKILNCEASYAIRARAGAPFLIRHSTLPFREGEELAVPALGRRVLERRDRLPGPREGTHWRVESWWVKTDGSPPAA